MNRKLRMGMIGGGLGAFIGGVHRMAATLDNRIELICGAFSSDPARSKASGADWLVPSQRVYGSYQQMLAAEKKLPIGERMDFVTIVTPNHMHFPVARAALQAGFHVICDKPLSLNLKEAEALVKLVDKTGLLFGLMHNYTGYPMVKEARALARGGRLGKLRKVFVEYTQGWLATCLEATGQKQAVWRTDPKRGGASGCMGDIGTHAANLAEYITGSKIIEVCADLTAFVAGRRLDDDGNILLRFDNGARGVLAASQVAVGEENNLSIRIYGEKGGLEWRQQEPNTLITNWLDKPQQVLRTGVDHGLNPAAIAATRLPAGHPEGFIEAFANIYENYASAVHATLAGEKGDLEKFDFPTVWDGLCGMKFVAAAVKSSQKHRWLAIEP